MIKIHFNNGTDRQYRDVIDLIIGDRFPYVNGLPNIAIDKIECVAERAECLIIYNLISLIIYNLTFNTSARAAVTNCRLDFSRFGPVHVIYSLYLI